MDPVNGTDDEYPDDITEPKWVYNDEDDQGPDNSTYMFELLANMPVIAFQQAIRYDIIYQVILVFGIFGNTLNLVVLTRPGLRGLTYVYLTWLAISDLLFLLVNSPVYIMLHVDPLLMFNYYAMFGLCRMTFALGNAFSTTSGFILSVLTVERHRAICCPLKYKEKFNRKQISALVFLLLFFAIFIYTPVVFQTRVKAEFPVANATNDTALLYWCKITQLTEHVEFQIYVIVREAIARVIPVILVTVLNVHIIFTLCKHQKSRQDLNCSTDSDRSLEERRMMYMLAAIVVTFLVCTTPQVFGWCLVTKKLAEQSGSYAIFDSIADLLLTINAASNFYLYCSCSPAIRRTLWDLIRRMFCRPLLQVAGIPWSIEYPIPSYSSSSSRSFKKGAETFRRTS